MRAALQEARKGLGWTSPNPAVGALLVFNNRIVARGHHRGAGLPHAEVECLQALDRPVHKSATLYVTLEPCSTIGRTPACTQEIIKAGVQRIVIGTIDPNPRHRGRGIALLRRAGVSVQTGILEAECATLNEAFNKWIVAGMPFVIAKCGMSLDGRLTRGLKEPRWITSAESRQHAQKLRAEVDAILIGAETARRDNPKLTVRGIRKAHQPVRVVLSRSGKLSRKAHLFSDRFSAHTLVYRNKSLRSVLAELGQADITSVLIEGGGNVLGQALDEALIDKLQIYLGPILTGGPVVAFPGRGADRADTAARLRRVHYERIGSDLCIIGYPEYNPGARVE